MLPSNSCQGASIRHVSLLEFRSFSCTHRPPYVDISSFSVIPYIHMTRMKRQNEEKENAEANNNNSNANEDA